MFASVFSQVSARLRHALAYVKAFAFLEDPPRAALAPAAGHDVTLAECAGDRRRGPGAGRAARPGVAGCAAARSGAGRSGRPPAPAQRCATPTTPGKHALPPRAPSKRRASVPGGFLHR